MSCPNLTLSPCIGETYRIRVTYASSGVPIDLTNWDISWSISAPGGLQVFTDPPQVVVTPLLGQIDLMLTTEQVDAYAGLAVYYQLLGTNTLVPEGEGDDLILEGRIRVE